MIIEYTTKDTSLNIKIEYKVARSFKNYPGIGKAWPKETQCLVYINGLLRGNGSVIKHEKDLDNQEYAYKLATKKAINCINLKFIRKEIWEILNNKLIKNNV